MSELPANSPRVGGQLPAKRLHEMNRLGDLGRFPVAVLAGATLNVLITIGVVWHFQLRSEHSYLGLPLWIAGVLALNLLPVAALRMFTLGPKTSYPIIEEMDFFRDQHKFSNWVYLVASVNMALWICAAWMASHVWHVQGVIALLMVAALVCVSSPGWIRWLRR